MGKRGPAKTPAGVLKLHGTFRDDRHGGPSVPAAAPSCPKWLDKVAATEWRRVIRDLVQLVGLAKIDRAMLAAYCQSYSNFVKADLWCRKNAALLGAATKKPAMATIRNEERAAMLRFGQQLGLSPSARTGLKIEIPEPEQAAERKFFG